MIFPTKDNNIMLTKLNSGTNKLVDGCYAFWQGASCALLGSINPLLTANSGWIFNESALQEYLLICCQQPLGGLIDKPGKYVRLSLF